MWSLSSVLKNKKRKKVWKFRSRHRRWRKKIAPLALFPTKKWWNSWKMWSSLLLKIEALLPWPQKNTLENNFKFLQYWFLPKQFPLKQISALKWSRKRQKFQSWESKTPKFWGERKLYSAEKFWAGKKCPRKEKIKEESSECSRSDRFDFNLLFWEFSILNYEI